MYVLVLTLVIPRSVRAGMYWPVPNGTRWYKVVQGGTRWYKVVQGGKRNGTRRFKEVHGGKSIDHYVHAGTCWYHVLMVLSGYAFLQDSLLQFCLA